MRMKLIAFLAVLMSAELGLAAQPAIYNLGTFSDGWSVGHAVNASGQVSGLASDNGRYAAFLYTGTPSVEGVMHDLGMLAGGDINDAGQVVGVHDSRAALYSGTPGVDGKIIDLGTLGGPTSVGIGISNSGQVTGSSATANVGYRAFLYTGSPGIDGVMHDLGSGYGEHSWGIDVNDSGQVAGYSGFGSSSTGPYHAFLYAGTPGADGTMKDLGTLGGSISRGREINASGQVVGDSQISRSTNFHAFLYAGTPGVDGVMHDLGTLGGAQSWGMGMNDAGQVVGSSFTANGSVHAFLHVGRPGIDGRMIDLDAWLDANNPVEGAKWALSDAYGLNNSGWITGIGSYNDGPGGMHDGSTIAFLLDASTLTRPPVAGDANGDGSVDLQDLNAVRDNFGVSGNNVQGDTNGDDVVDLEDLNAVRNNFGGAALPVPEPSSLVLVAVSALAFLLKKAP